MTKPVTYAQKLLKVKFLVLKSQEEKTGFLLDIVHEDGHTLVVPNEPVTHLAKLTPNKFLICGLVLLKHNHIFQNIFKHQIFIGIHDGINAVKKFHMSMSMLFQGRKETGENITRMLTKYTGIGQVELILKL